MTAPPVERPPEEWRKLTVSERSVDELTEALQDWLAARSAGEQQPTVTNVHVPDKGGLSSTSVLFEACWLDEDEPGRRGAYVARMAPEASAVPVFPRYDLPAQFDVISQVAARCDVPLPTLRFDSCSVTVILQENADGYRTLNDARRVLPGGRVDQLGWPRVEIGYRAGTRHPESARIHLTDGAGMSRPGSRTGRPSAPDQERGAGEPRYHRAYHWVVSRLPGHEPRKPYNFALSRKYVCHREPCCRR